MDLAQLQHEHRQLLSEVAELRCVKNRETVNMDYLKNIVLQVFVDYRMQIIYRVY